MAIKRYEHVRYTLEAVCDTCGENMNHQIERDVPAPGSLRPGPARPTRRESDGLVLHRCPNGHEAHLDVPYPQEGVTMREIRGV